MFQKIMKLHAQLCLWGVSNILINCNDIAGNYRFQLNRCSVTKYEYVFMYRNIKSTLCVLVVLLDLSSGVVRFTQSKATETEFSPIFD